MAPKWVDSHCHMAFLKNDELLEDFITNQLNLGVGRLCQGGYDLEDWQRQIKLKKNFPKIIHTAFGIHPWVVNKLEVKELDGFLEKLNYLLPQADVFGELGLDEAVKDLCFEKQMLFFKKQLELNLKYDKPLVLHIVRAHNKALEILRTYKYRGFIHGFNGTYELAKSYISLGYLISVGPLVFNGKNSKLRGCIEKLASNEFILETDQPGGSRLEINNQCLLQVARVVANIRSCSVEEVLDSSADNYNQLLRS